MSLEKRNERLSKETWIISRTEEGFRVYSPAEPARSYIVSDGPAGPRCTCADFENHERHPGWQCKHIRAILNQLQRPSPAPREPDPYDVEERRAIQAENQAPEEPVRPNGGTSEMLLKRSVSPDGRIDSLSIEFSCPVDGASVRDIKTRAEKTLQLQAEIVERFLSRNHNKGTRRNDGQGQANGEIPAQMIDVGGMNGKWGRRLFINFRANGKILKLFGSRKQLAEHVIAAGFPQQASGIAEGLKLNLPCRIVTKPSEDGRFTDIETVLPAHRSETQRR